MEYAKASNLGAVAVYLVMLLGAQTAQIGKSIYQDKDGVITALLGGRVRTRLRICNPNFFGSDVRLTHCCIGGSVWLKDWSSVRLQSMGSIQTQH
jgi:hypothetical protein